MQVRGLTSERVPLRSYWRSPKRPAAKAFKGADAALWGDSIGERRRCGRNAFKASDAALIVGFK